MSIGKKISSILTDVEEAIWDHDYYLGIPPEYTDEGLRAATKIFMSVIMDSMYKLQVNEDLTQEDKENMAKKCGKDLRSFVKTYTDIDTHSLYK